jgi:hypothetical protein
MAAMTARIFQYLFIFCILLGRSTVPCLNCIGAARANVTRK